MKRFLKNFSLLLCGGLFTATGWAAISVATWTDFDEDNLTSGSYTIKKGEGCTVNDNGSITLGGNGLQLDLTDAEGLRTEKVSHLSVVMDVTVPETFSDMSLASFCLDNNFRAEVRVISSKLRSCWWDQSSQQDNSRQGDYTLTSGRQTIVVTYKGASKEGTHAYVDGDEKVADTGMFSSGNPVSYLTIGARYNGANQTFDLPATGMVVHSLRLYSSKLSADDVAAISTVKAKDFIAAFDGNNTIAGANSWAEGWNDTYNNNPDEYVATPFNQGFVVKNSQCPYFENQSIPTTENYTLAIYACLSETNGTLWFMGAVDNSTSLSLKKTEDGVVLARNDTADVVYNGNAVRDGAYHWFTTVVKNEGDTTSLTLYVDSEEVTSSVTTQLRPTPGLQLGSQLGGYNGATGTIIDEVYGWNNALTQAEVDALCSEAPIPAPATYVRTIDANADWSATDAWTLDGTSTVADVPAEGKNATITVTANAVLTMNAAANIGIFTTTGDGTLTIDTDGTNKLSAQKTNIEANTILNAGAASLGAVTIAKDKTLTVDRNTRWTSINVLGALKRKTTDLAVISLNVAKGRNGTDNQGPATSSDDEIVGLEPVPGLAWENLNGGHNTTTTLSSAKIWTGNRVGSHTCNVQLKAANTYTTNSEDKPVDGFLYAYLDDGNRAQVNVTNIPFSQYSVIVYCATDQGSKRFSPVTVNDKLYTVNEEGETVETTQESDIFGVCRMKYATYATKSSGNAIRVDNLNGDLTIQGGGNANGARGGIAAIQIVNTSKSLYYFEAKIPESDTGEVALSTLLDGCSLADGADVVIDFGETSGQTFIFDSNENSLNLSSVTVIGKNGGTLTKTEGAKTIAITTTTINTNTIIDAGVGNFGAVTIAEGKTLTVKDNATINSISGGALTIDGTVEFTKNTALMLDEIRAYEGVVTLKGRTTMEFPVDSSELISQFDYFSGEHTLQYGRSSSAENLFATGKGDENPTIRIRNSATLNFKLRDLSGWGGNVSANPAVIRVEEGGKLNLYRADGSGFFRDRLILDHGAVVKNENNPFVLHGGASTESKFAQIAMLDSETVATATFEGRLGLCNTDGGGGEASGSRAASIYVGNNATLTFDGEFDADEVKDSAYPLLRKLGAGVMVVKNMLDGGPDIAVEKGVLKFTGDATLKHTVVNSGTIAADGADVVVDLTGTKLSGNGSYSVTNNATLILPAGVEGTADSEGNIASRVTVENDGKLVLQLSVEQMLDGYTAKVSDSIAVSFRDSEGNPIEGVEGNTYTPAVPTWTPTLEDSTWDNANLWNPKSVPASGNIIIVTSALEAEMSVEIPSMFDSITVRGNNVKDTEITFATDVTQLPSLQISGRVKLSPEVINGLTAISFIGDSAVLVANVTSNADLTKSLSGNFMFEKAGTGTLTLKANVSPEQGSVIANGIVKFDGSNAAETNAFGSGVWKANGTVENQYAGKTGDVLVKTGAELDVNGHKGAWLRYVTLEADAKFVNRASSVGVGNTQRQCAGIILEGDAEVIALADFGLVGSAYAATTLNLNGHTLKKTGTHNFITRETSVSNGTLDFQGGGLAGTDDVIFANGVTIKFASGTTFNPGNATTYQGAVTFNMAQDTQMTIASNIPGNVTKDGTGSLTLSGVLSGDTSTLTVNGGTLILTAANTRQGDVTIASDATLDISGENARLGYNGANRKPTITVNGVLKVRNWGWDDGACLGKVDTNANHLVVNGGEIHMMTSQTSDRNFTVGADGAKIVLADGVTYTYTGNYYRDYDSDYDSGYLKVNGTLVFEGNGTFAYAGWSGNAKPLSACTISSGTTISTATRSDNKVIDTIGTLTLAGGAIIDATNGAVTATAVTLPQTGTVKVRMTSHGEVLLTSDLVEEDAAKFAVETPVANWSLVVTENGLVYVAAPDTGDVVFSAEVQEMLNAMAQAAAEYEGITSLTIEGITLSADGENVVKADIAGLELFDYVPVAIVPDGQNGTGVAIVNYVFGINSISVNATGNIVVKASVDRLAMENPVELIEGEDAGEGEGEMPELPRPTFVNGVTVALYNGTTEIGTAEVNVAGSSEIEITSRQTVEQLFGTSNDSNNNNDDVGSGESVAVVDDGSSAGGDESNTEGDGSGSDDQSSSPSSQTLQLTIKAVKP